MGWDKALFYTAEAGVAALVIFQAWFQIGKWMRGQPINLPKQIFLGSVVRCMPLSVSRACCPATPCSPSPRS